MTVGKSRAKVYVETDTKEGNVQGRCRRRGSKIRVAGAGRVSAQSEVLRPAGRAGAERRFAGHVGSQQTDSVGDAGVLLSEALLVAKKSRPADKRWVYLDAGRHNGLAETSGRAHPLSNSHAA
jgi:hypothetical protein